jgi:hypothetical protein
MTAQWKDTTSYIQGARGTVEPRSWTLDGALVSITVHRYIGCGDAWFVTCRQAGLEAADLNGPTLEDAKRQALDRVRQTLRMLANDADALAS